MPEPGRGMQAEHPRRAARLIALVLATAALAVMVGSCLWAWTSDDFWESVPLYPAVVTAGTLAGFALYARRRQLLRAGAFTLATALVTLLGTAIITLARWGN